MRLPVINCPGAGKMLYERRFKAEITERHHAAHDPEQSPNTKSLRPQVSQQIRSDHHADKQGEESSSATYQGIANQHLGKVHGDMHR